MSKSIINTNDLIKDLEHNDDLLADKSICFTEGYARTFENMENGKAENFVYTSDNGTVSHTFIKRKIQSKIQDIDFYDIITPYGFGGPIVLESTNKETLLKEYFDKFHKYCISNNIVSEFIRFHIFENVDVLKQFTGEKVLSNSVICRDLKKDLNVDFESRLLKDVEKAKNFGISIDFDYTGKTQLDFLNVYTDTMNRNNASDFYYIDKLFLDKLQKQHANHFLYANARMNGEITASRLILFDDKYGYYFLGGNLKEFYKYKNGTFLDYSILVEMKSKGLKQYVFGGGHKEKDGIYNYKKKFDKNGEVPFYVGRKIHMKIEYEYLSSLRKEKSVLDPNTMFFPLYRAPIEN